MYKLLFTIGVVLLCSCNNTVEQYKKIIAEADSAEIYYANSNKIIRVLPQQFAQFRNILIRGIQPEEQHNITSNISITLFRNSRKIAYLHIATTAQKSFVNFYADSLAFGFRLPYGISMFVDNLQQ